MGKHLENHILVIEDDADMLALFRFHLDYHGYKNIHTVETGLEGLDVCRSVHSIDLVFTDMKLPDLDGVELIKQLKHECPTATIISMTGYSSVSMAVQAIQNGAYDFIEKPIDFDSFFLRFDKIWEKRESDLLIAQLAGRIFMSYASEDFDRVAPIYEKLKAANYQPWMDRFDLKPGEKWELSIKKTIKNSAFFLVFLSNKSVGKRAMIQKEIKAGLKVWEQMLEDDIYLIPVRLEACSIPPPLGSFHWVDMFEKDGFDKLMSGIREGLLRRTQQ